jgi:hypothetical protein
MNSSYYKHTYCIKRPLKVAAMADDNNKNTTISNADENVVLN